MTKFQVDLHSLVLCNRNQSHSCIKVRHVLNSGSRADYLGKGIPITAVTHVCWRPSSTFSCLLLYQLSLTSIIHLCVLWKDRMPTASPIGSPGKHNEENRHQGLSCLAGDLRKPALQFFRTPAMPLEEPPPPAGCVTKPDTHHSMPQFPLL